jgi:zinc protease
VKRNALILTTLLLAASAAAQSKIDIKPPAGGIDLPAYTRTALPNGLVVLLMERPNDPLVHMRLAVRSGSASDPAGKEGLASLTASLLTAGTTTRSAAQIASEVDFAGGTLAASADRDTTQATAEFLARDAKKEIELLADVVLRPAFAKEEVERVRTQRAAEIAAAGEDPDSFATSQFYAALLAGTRYAHDPMGKAATIPTITRDDVAAFHKSRYAPNESVLAIVGGFQAGPMLDLVRNAFGKWEKRNVAKIDVGTPKAVEGKKLLVVDAPGMNQTQVRIGSAGIKRNDPDFVAISVANAILSSGFSSRLTEEIRVNRSLTYSIRSIFSAWANPGPHFISTFTRNATTRDIIDATFGELQKFREGPITESELTRAKNIVLSRNLLGLETAEALATMISTIEIHNLPRDYVETLAPKVQALTTESIRKTIGDHFEAGNVLILLYTTASETEAKLQGLGTIAKVKSVD